MDCRYRNIQSILIRIRKQNHFFLHKLIFCYHFVILSGPTSELAEKTAALKLSLLLITL